MFEIVKACYSEKYYNTITTLLSRAGFVVNETNNTIQIEPLSQEDQELLETLNYFNIF